jgi:Protein of unknown function (DUF4435)
MLSDSELRDRLALEAQHFKDSIFHLRKDMGVRVEARDDIPFWKHAFQRAMPDLKPEFFPECYEHPAAGTQGKQGVLQLKAFADKELILCVDSDYDYLLQTNVIGNQLFVFQTYTYSFENYKCYAPVLAQLCARATFNDMPLFDFEWFLKQYSNIIFELLVYALYLEQVGLRLLARDTFNALIHIKQRFNIQKEVEKVLAELQAIVTHQLKILKLHLNTIDFNTFKNTLAQLGLNADNAYLFIQGHTLMDKVVFRLMHLVINDLRNMKYQQFNEIKIDINDFKRKKKVYDATIQTPKNILESHTDYEDCFLFQKIIRDIRNVFATTT